jgi:predicted dithiol-disulfide oxidoreductase (DUF899 family)
MTEHAVVSHEEWLAARKALLAEEKDFTQRRDELSRRRRELPWEPVTDEYVFAGENGPETLAELFGDRSQLVVYHFMYPEDWEAGCPSCSFWADSFDPNVVHLAARDIRLVAVSKAPLEKLLAYRERMGWTFHWVSSFDNDFNGDFRVGFTPEEQDDPVYNYGGNVPGMAEREGVSVFVKDADGAVFHTYSAYARGIDVLNAAYNYIDLTPKGRDEVGQGTFPQFWVRRHDEYDR